MNHLSTPLNRRIFTAAIALAAALSAPVMAQAPLE